MNGERDTAIASTIDQIIASRKSLYDPERALISQQAAALPGQQQAAEQGLETAKTNAFGDIVKGANARGVVYSGAPIEDQNRYVGEKYLPAKANLAADFLGRRSKLDESLLGINRDEMTSAQQLQQQQVKDEQEAAYRQQQLQLERERMAQQAAQAAARLSSKAPRQPSTAERQQAFNQDLMSAFQYANSNYKPFIREQVAQQLAATYGFSLTDAQKQVNSVFTDSWDKAKRGAK